MRRRTRQRWLAYLIVSLVVAGCGGSSSSSRSSTPSATAVSPSAAATTSAATTSAATTSATATRSAESSSASTAAAGGPDTNVRLPATFSIGAHGVLFPPLIAAPKRTDVALTVRVVDTQVHAFVLKAPHEYRFTVSRGHRVHVLLKAIPIGRYAIEIDNVRRGALVIGAAPGP